jgi:hypothetical protein
MGATAPTVVVSLEVANLTEPEVRQETPTPLRSDRRETRKPVGRSHGATNRGSDQGRPSVSARMGQCLQEECLPSGGPESSNGNLMSDVLQDSLVAMPAAESCRGSAASDLGHQRGSEALFQHRKASPLVIVHSKRRRPRASTGCGSATRRKTMTSRCSASSQPCNHANSIGSGNTYQRQRHQSDLDANGSRTGEVCDASAGIRASGC